MQATLYKESQFPPTLSVGNRVWSDLGYIDHGPVDGTKINIPASLGGMIVGIEKPYMTMDHFLYVIRWDNEQVSRHYDNKMLCIGRFATRDDFEAALVFHGNIQIVVGPQGGFREAHMQVSYDSSLQKIHLHRDSRQLWIDCLQPLATQQGVKIDITRLPIASRKD